MAEPSGGSSTTSRSSSGLRDTSFAQRTEAPDIVRPGRLLTTLSAMQQELEDKLGQADGAAEVVALLQRLDDIKLEALVALDRVQQGSDYEVALQQRDAHMAADAVNQYS